MASSLKKPTHSAAKIIKGLMLVIVFFGTMYAAMKDEAPLRFWIEYARGWVVILVSLGAAVLAGFTRALTVRIRRRSRPTMAPGVAVAAV